MKFIEKVSYGSVVEMCKELNLCTSVTEGEFNELLSLINEDGGRTYTELVTDLAKAIFSASNDYYTVSSIASYIFNRCTRRYCDEGLREYNASVLREIQQLEGEGAGVIKELLSRCELPTSFTSVYARCRFRTLQGAYQLRRMKEEQQNNNLTSAAHFRNRFKAACDDVQQMIKEDEER